jgi:hypothetical protein
MNKKNKEKILIFDKNLHCRLAFKHIKSMKNNIKISIFIFKGEK